jgi:hypothetical protein
VNWEWVKTSKHLIERKGGGWKKLPNINKKNMGECIKNNINIK